MQPPYLVLPQLQAWKSSGFNRPSMNSGQVSFNLPVQGYNAFQQSSNPIVSTTTWKLDGPKISVLFLSGLVIGFGVGILMPYKRLKSQIATAIQNYLLTFFRRMPRQEIKKLTSIKNFDSLKLIPSSLTMRNQAKQSLVRQRWKRAIGAVQGDIRKQKIKNQDNVQKFQSAVKAVLVDLKVIETQSPTFWRRAQSQLASKLVIMAQDEMKKSKSRILRRIVKDGLNIAASFCGPFAIPIKTVIKYMI